MTVLICGDEKIMLIALEFNTAIMMPFVIGLDLINFVRTVLNLHTTDDHDFIGKPFKPSELILRIKRIIQTLKT